jgi:hypothetical protein
VAADASAKLAVGIDADNASPAANEGLLAEVTKYGIAYVRRTYGGWTGASMRAGRISCCPSRFSPSSSFPTPRARTPPTRR